MGVKNTSLLLASKWKVKSVQNYCSRALQNYYYFFSLQNIQDLLERTDDGKEYLLKSCQLTLFVFQNSPFSELPSTTQRWFSSPKWVDRKHWLTLGLLRNSWGKHEWAAAWQHQAGKTIKIWRVVPKLIMAGNSLSILHLNDSGLCLLPKRCVRAMQNGISIVDPDARSIPI